MSDASVDLSNSKDSGLTAFFRSFTDHPASVDESYWQHSKFALRFAGKLMQAGGAALVHAFIPALFETTASRMVTSLNRELTARHSADAIASAPADSGAGAKTAVKGE